MPRTARRTVLRTAAAALCLSVLPMHSGCAIGVDSATSQQGPSGNGSNANQGPLQLRGVTIVTGPAGSDTATILGTIVNTGTTADALQNVTITSPTGATVTLRGTALSGSELPLLPQSATRLGFAADDHADITGLVIAPSAYTTVTFTFKVAGTLTMGTTGQPFQVMAVLPTGVFEGIAPLAP